MVGIIDESGAQVVSYDYSAWGEVLSITGSGADTIGQLNPIRYRGYYYDNETGFYYLQSRYYDPVTQRFLNADGLVAGVNASTNGYNLFAYCFNNPVNLDDSSGNWPSFIKKAVDTVKNVVKQINNAVNSIVEKVKDKFVVKHDVPLYCQGNTDLCWAYCQIMVEDYESKTSRPEYGADLYAKAIAVDKYGEENWNRPSWPNNLGEKVNIKNNLSLFFELKKGPLYGYYAGENWGHYIVITGIDLWTGTIYTNNPWGMHGEQTRAEFQSIFKQDGSEAKFKYAFRPS